MGAFEGCTDCSGGGGTGTAQSSSYIGFGQVDVSYPDSYYIKDEAGNRVLDENGHPVLQEFTSPYILDERNEIVLDEDDSPVTDENWRNLIIRGVITQLDSLSVTIQYVTIQAKKTNLGKIWIGNSGVDFDRGLYLSTGSEPVTLSIDALTKVYIIGNAGEGVTYLYGTNDDIFLQNTDGLDLVNTDGEDLENT